MRLTACLLFLSLLMLAASEDEHDTCECRCCSGVPITCASVDKTTFPTPSCSDCRISACAKHFPLLCGAKDAGINAACVERTAWYLQLIPLLFIAATIGLLFYGFFIKTFDGYNPMPAVVERALARTPFSPRPSIGTPLPPLDPRTPFAVRRPSPLSQSLPFSRPVAAQPAQYGAVAEANASGDALPSFALSSTPTSVKGGPGSSSPLLPAATQFDGVPTVHVKNGNRVATPEAESNGGQGSEGLAGDAAGDVEGRVAGEVKKNTGVADKTGPKHEG